MFRYKIGHVSLNRGGRKVRLSSNVLQQETYKYQQPAASGLFSRGGRQGTSRFSSGSKEKGKMVRRKVSAIVKSNDERWRRRALRFRYGTRRDTGSRSWIRGYGIKPARYLYERAQPPVSNVNPLRS